MNTPIHVAIRMNRQPAPWQCKLPQARFELPVRIVSRFILSICMNRPPAYLLLLPDSFANLHLALPATMMQMRYCGKILAKMANTAMYFLLSLDQLS